MKKSRIARPIAAVESPAVRSLPLVDLLVDTKAELFELMVRSGLRVLDAMLEEDRTALCGPRYAHQPARAASRTGRVPSDVVVGGRKVAVSRPRVRADGREVPLPTFQALAHTDPLNRRVVEQMLVGVATRQYARSLEPLPADVVSRGTSKSSVSRRFVAKTTAQLPGVAIGAAGRPRPRGAAPRRRTHRGALPRGGARDRRRWPETRARPVGGRHREYGRVSEPLGESRESGAPDRPQPPA